MRTAHKCCPAEYPILSLTCVLQALQLIFAVFTHLVSQMYVPHRSRQKLFTDRMLTTHPPLTTDSFTLYIKGASLIGKVKTFNIRYRMRYTFDQDAATNPYDPKPSTRRGQQDPRGTMEFQVLDTLIKNYIDSIPKDLRDPVRGGKVDPVLYTAHLLPHA